MIHELKISSKYFYSVCDGSKTFEVRYKDRDYKVGDILKLCEFNNGGYSGNFTTRVITYVLDDDNCKNGYVILGIK